MNYLAHIYLSGNDKELTIGNFIADSVKGNILKKKLPQRVKDGIILHRKIDTFTDSHPIVYKSKHRLFDKYSHYSSVIVDILYDHFLAKNWQNYHSTKLNIYVENFYLLLKYNFEILPKPVQNFYPYMVSHNWLLSYAEIDGIERILKQMNNRINGKIRLDHSVIELKEYYTEFEEEFTEFFTELTEYVTQEIKEG